MLCCEGSPMPQGDVSFTLKVANHSISRNLHVAGMTSSNYKQGFVIWEWQSFGTTRLYQPVIMFQQAIIPNVLSCASPGVLRELGFHFSGMPLAAML